jgi:hypothetical protein
VLVVRRRAVPVLRRAVVVSVHVCARR